jgi:hypothetical protein
MSSLISQVHDMPGSRVIRFIKKEVTEALPAIVLFAAGFNLIELTTQLILDDYDVRFANFMVATMSALVVGKAVLAANALPFLHRFDRAPLIQPILFKTLVYWACVFLARLLERIIEYWMGGGSLGGTVDFLISHFTWHRFAAIQIWVFVLFLIYTTAAEINALLGHGELYRIFFTRQTSEMELTRRQRVRTLVKLSHLTEAHGADELINPRTGAHRELVGLIEALATHHAALAQPDAGADPMGSETADDS